MLQRVSQIVSRRRLYGMLAVVFTFPILLSASPAFADLVYDPADVTIGNNPSQLNGTYLNAQDLADNLVFTSISVLGSSTLTVADPIDMSTSTFGTPHFNLSLVAPVCNIAGNINLAAQGHLNLTCGVLNLNGRVTSGGTDIDPSRVTGTATQVNVGSNASIQQAIQFSTTVSAPLIKVGAGNYAGNLAVNKPLTLSGDDGSNLPGAGPNAPVINGTQPGGNVIAVNANGVSIDGLHLNGVVGNGSPAPSVNGIVANNVDGFSATFNTLNGFSGPGIATGASTNVTLSNNLIVPLPPTQVLVAVSGSQTYGSSTPAFSYSATPPNGVTLSGTLVCTTVDNETAINATLGAGSHTLDPTSCSGLDTSDNAYYVVSYTTAANDFTVGVANQTTTFTSTAPSNAVVGGAGYTPVASATSNLPVAITVDSSSASVCNVSSGNVSFQNAGTCMLDANQAGNANYNAAPQVQQSFTVSRSSQTVSFTSTAPANAVVGGTAYTPSASATSGLSAAITVDASSSSVCSVSGGVVSFQHAGTCTLNANQSGNAAFNPASQVQQSFTVNSSVPTWSGFQQPINADGSSVFKLGRTVPVKFQLTGASAGITNLQAKLYVTKITNNIQGTDVEAISTSAADTGNTFRYDATSQQYVFNLGTSSLTMGTYQLKIYVNGDNTTSALLGAVNVSLSK